MGQRQGRGGSPRQEALFEALLVAGVAAHAVATAAAAEAVVVAQQGWLVAVEGSGKPQTRSPAVRVGAAFAVVAVGSATVAANSAVLVCPVSAAIVPGGDIGQGSR